VRIYLEGCLKGMVEGYDLGDILEGIIEISSLEMV